MLKALFIHVNFCIGWKDSKWEKCTFLAGSVENQNLAASSVIVFS